MATQMKDLQDKVIQFGRARNWQQFHSPKNLSMALSVEASELVEIFQWLTEEESDAIDDTKKDAVASELADIFMYSLLLADRLGIDIEDATRKKLKRNETRYPVEKYFGSNEKTKED